MGRFQYMLRRVTMAALFMLLIFLFRRNMHPHLYLQHSAERRADLSHDKYDLPGGVANSSTKSGHQADTSNGKVEQPEEPVACPSSGLDTPSYILTRNTSGSNVTCVQLIGGDETGSVYKEARALMERDPMKKVPDERLSLLTQDCKKFKSTRGYHLNPGSKEEMEFPIAFNLLVHKDAYQVEFLLRAIYRPQNQYCIHVDAKTPRSLHEAIEGLVRCFDNVFIASKLEHVVYAGFSRLQADINCMKDHLEQKKKWKYLFNLAGQAFPVKTNREIVEILKIYNGSNDVEGIFGSRIHRSRFENEWKEVEIETGHKQIIQTGEKNPPAPFSIDIVRGSAYAVFSRQFVHFIINDEKAKALLDWSRNTWSPDEHYWATLHHTYTNPHLHTPGGYSGKPDAKPWLAVWVAWGGMDKCHGQWVRGTCVFGVEDLPMLVSRHEFFINKLHYDYQPLTLQCLNSWLEYRVQCPKDIDRDYYSKLPFVSESIR